MALGNCSRCGRTIKSRSFKYCPSCARELRVCQRCGMPSDRLTCTNCEGSPILH